MQHQIELLQAQQQQMLSAHNQYVNMGLISPGQNHLAPVAFNLQQPMPHLSPQPQHSFQFPQPQQAAPAGAPTQPSGHRRQGSGLGGGPPAPSSGSAANMGDNSGGPQRRPSGGQNSGAPGHTRRHSLALADAKKAAEQAQARRGQTGQTPPAGFQFPIPNPAGPNAPPPAPASPATPGTATSITPTLTTTPATTTDSSTTSTGTSGTPSRNRIGHGRSQSMAVGGSNGRSAVSNTGRLGFQFPTPSSTGDSQTGGQQSSGQNVERRVSGGHQRSGSRNYQDNWRNPSQTQNVAPADPQPQIQNQPQQFNTGFQPGHRPRASMGTLGSFTFPAQPGILIPSAPSQGIFMNPATGQPQLLNTNLLTQHHPLTHIQLHHAQAMNTQPMGMGPIGVPAGQAQQMSNQQQRKTLFTPYLPQATLPALLSNGQLVSGILRVNKKNRSDAYVSTQDGLLDADIFICGSKDRNRALEGDLVAVELLDVDEVWGQKREKEEKKKRKDNTVAPGAAGSGAGSTGAGEGGEQNGQEGGVMRRRGSLKLRNTQKKNDDVEVEGQSLLLVEEEEINDEQKPLYAGHIVAVIERVAGQMFSG